MLSLLKRVPGWVWALLPTSIGLNLGYFYLIIGIRDSYLPNQSSTSIAQARERGILLQTYQMAPRTIRYENYELQFDECWQEKQTRRTHAYIFFPRTVQLKQTIVLLNYRVRHLAPEPDTVQAPSLLLNAREVTVFTAWSALKKAGTGTASLAAIAAQASFAQAANPTLTEPLLFDISRETKRTGKPVLTAYPATKTVRITAGTILTPVGAPKTAR